MKIYFGHSKSLDYQSEYYEPILRSDILKNHNLIFPHLQNKDTQFGREFYQEMDLFIAEVSYPATGLGIELGWAWDSKVPIYCLYKKGMHLSSSLTSISDHFIAYESKEELVREIEKVAQGIK